MNTHVVIMAGGIGSRFWPMSTPDFPKQFIDVMGVGKSLIQLTVERFRQICPPENCWIVTAERYADIVKEQLPQVPEGNILAEPAARNTAPCIAYACWKIKERDADAHIVVTPSDALVIDTAEFRSQITRALAFVEENREAIVTLGITPSRPETGYGYICAAGPSDTDREVLKVEAFKEKPNLETAEAYLAQGNYFWNAGIFVWNTATIVKELRMHAPQIAGVMDRMAAHFGQADEKETVQQLFPTCEKISIDYAVMEKAQEIFVLPSEFGWSDLGSWGSLQTLLPQDELGNAGVGGRIKMINCKNCVVHTAEEKSVILEGLDGYIVAEKNNTLLVCRLSEEQRIKDFAQD